MPKQYHYICKSCQTDYGTFEDCGYIEPIYCYECGSKQIEVKEMTGLEEVVFN